MEKKVGGYCAMCNMQGTVYHVKGTEDFYEYVLAGVLYKVREGETFNTKAAMRKELEEHRRRSKEERGINTTWTEDEEEELSEEPSEEEVIEETIEEIVEEEVETSVPEETDEEKIARLEKELAELED
jgi:hypothetical protein